MHFPLCRASNKKNRACGGLFQCSSLCINVLQPRCIGVLKLISPCIETTYCCSPQARKFYNFKACIQGEIHRICPPQAKNFKAFFLLNIVKVMYFWPAAGEKMLASFSRHLTDGPKNKLLIPPSISNSGGGRGG